MEVRICKGYKKTSLYNYLEEPQPPGKVKRSLINVECGAWQSRVACVLNKMVFNVDWQVNFRIPIEFPIAN